jgi:lysophospholipase L1-like esterase
MKLRRLSPALVVLSAGLLATAVFTVSCTTTPPAAAIDPVLLNPATNSAIRPEPRDPNWVKRHESFVALPKAGMQVLFLGDSITDFWRRDNNPRQGGGPVWKKNYEPLHAINLGISGDRTQHVLWRMEHGELDGLAPKLVVLMIGTNNTGFERDNKTVRNTVPETIEGVKAVVQGLRTKLPGAKILLLAIFPRGEKPDNPQRVQVNEINRSLAKLDDGKMIRYLDIGPKFLTADGTLTKEIMPDFLHPNEHGYEIWADAMRPLLTAMLK